MSCGAGHRRSSDPMLLWLWCRPAATAPIRPLAWESPYAVGAAQEKAKRQKTKTKTKYTRTYAGAHCGSVVTSPTSIHDNGGSIPGLAEQVKGSGIAVSYGVDHRKKKCTHTHQKGPFQPFFFPGLHLWYIKVPRLVVELGYNCQPTPQLQQCQI